MSSFNTHLFQMPALLKVLNYQGIKMDPDVINDELEKHPDSPSLLAVCDVLTALNIETSAFRIPSNELVNMPCPFLAHMMVGNGDMIAVTQIDGNDIYVSNDKWENHRMNIDDFKKEFTGIVLTVEPSETFTAGSTLKSKLKAFKTPVIILSLALVFIAALVFQTAYITNLTWQTLLLTIFKSAGLITAVLLLIQSIDKNNPWVQAICNSTGKTDCNAVLSSKASNVFEGLTWSEVGFFYFAGTWLLLLFGGGSQQVWQVLALLNFISLPYTVYSIYYQARVAKQWCVLCCAVQALLWLEFIPLVYNFSKTPFLLQGGNQGQLWSAVFICLLAPIILWATLKPLFLKVQQMQPLREQLHKFKYNAELFNKLLTEQQNYALPAEEWTIVLGNVEANNIFTIATNPYCPPCADMHKLLDEALDQNCNIQLRVVFTAQNTESDPNTRVSRHLMALNQLPDKKLVKQALHDWYGQKQKNYEAWAKVYPVQLNETEFYKLDKQKDWCTQAEITGTPTLLLNGYRLPKLYQVRDLKYMLQ